MQIFNDLGPASSLASERDNFLEEMADDTRMWEKEYTHTHTRTYTYIFMCMDILPACMPVYHLCIWSPEEGLGSPETGVTVLITTEQPPSPRPWVQSPAMKNSLPCLDFTTRFG